jgi:hypothetical protein
MVPKIVEPEYLPQYNLSEYFMLRYLDTSQSGTHDINQIFGVPDEDSINPVHEAELKSDALEYFRDNKNSMRSEFLEDIAEKIGQYKSEKFCEIIANKWFAGTAYQKDSEILQLKLSVKNYLGYILNKDDNFDEIVKNHAIECKSSLFCAKDIASILTVNDILIEKYINEWMLCYENDKKISKNDIFLKRGLRIKNMICSDTDYIEQDYINSYSISITVPEKFSITKSENKKTSTLVNGEIDLFGGRFLFFSPFIPDMDLCELEFGIIAWKPIQIEYQGECRGIHEYILGEGPWNYKTI